MICFKRGELDEIVRKKAWLGINKDTYSRTTNNGNYKWRYDVEYVGDKGHGNSVMAAMGIVQLKYLDRDNAYRRQLANWYREGLRPCGDKVKIVRIEDGCESSCHLFQICVKKRDELMMALNAEEIYPGVHYASNINYRMYGYAKGTCPYADYVSEHAISLPMNMYVSYADVQKICGIIGEFVDKGN